MKRKEAKRAICELIRDSVIADATTLLGYEPLIVYPKALQKEPKIDNSKHWMRITLNQLEGEQAAFCTRGNGKRLYKNEGVVIVQFFAPSTRAEAADEQEDFAQLVQDALRSVNLPGQIWFNHAAIKDTPDENTLLRLNVTAEYNYRDVA